MDSTQNDCVTSELGVSDLGNRLHCQLMSVKSSGQKKKIQLGVLLKISSECVNGWGGSLAGKT